MSKIIKENTELGEKWFLSMPVRYISYTPEYIRNGDNFIDIPKDSRKKTVIDLELSITHIRPKTRIPNYRKGINDCEICPVLHNSLDDPLPVNFIEGRKGRLAEFVSYISVLKYKDTGNLVFTFATKKLCYLSTTGRAFFTNGDVYSLKICHDRNGSLTKNNLLCMTTKQLHQAFSVINTIIFQENISKHKEYSAIRRLYVKSFYGGELPRESHQDAYSSVYYYRVQRNANLKDLPWSVSKLTTLYDPIYINNSEYDDCPELDLNSINARFLQGKRASMNRYLRLGDTKKAVDACFYGYVYPKSIRKVLLKTRPMEFGRYLYEYLYECLQVKPVDLVRRLITEDDGVTPNKDILWNPVFLHALMIGINPQYLTKQNKRLIKDTMIMHTALADAEWEFDTISNLRRYHDYLVPLHNMLVVNTDDVMTSAYLDVDTSRQMAGMIEDGYVIRSPYNANELIDVGTKMHHCVSGYRESFFYQEFEVVLMTDMQGEYVVCLEVVGKDIVQAKLIFNNPISDNPLLMNIVKKWASLNSLRCVSRDFGNTKLRPISSNKPRNKARVEYVNRLRLNLS